MSLPKFTHMTPSTLAEAVSLLKSKGEGARVMAGGTDLTVNMKQRVEVPEFLINIKELKELQSIQTEQGGVKIGALTTLEAISNSEKIKENFGPVAQAAGRVGSVQLRNVGTIGGNVCLNTRCWYYNQSKQWRKSIPTCFKLGGDQCLVIKGSDKCNAVFLADTVPALMAYDGSLRIVKDGGERTIPLGDFYNGSGHPPNLLSPEEILAEIHLPKPAANSFGIFFKDAPREVVDFALVNLALRITFEGKNGACKDARIAVGGVTHHPVRSTKGEDMLKGEKITGKLIDDLAEVVVKDLTPVSPIWVSPHQRRQTVKFFLKKGLEVVHSLAEQRED